MTTPTVLTQTGFAALLGLTKGRVSQLKAAGRLVMTDTGMVDVAASQALILATRDPNRDDVVQRHAVAREGVTALADSPPQRITSPASEDFEAGDIVDFQTARAIKENYLAKQAKIDYEERIGKLVDAESVSLKHYEMARQVRDSIMSIPARIGEQIAAESNPAVVTRMLEDEIRQALETAAKFAGQMDADATAAEEGGV